LSPEQLPIKPGVLPVLRIMSLGHSMVAFVNGELVGKHTELRKHHYKAEETGY